jgi:hypothetical protein
MARAVPRETIAVRTSTREGSNMLEWRPRLIALIIVVVLISIVAGSYVLDTAPLNWEW